MSNDTVYVYGHEIIGMTPPLNLIVGGYLIVLLVSAMIMNVLVVLVFIREKSLRRPGSYLLVNLSIADFCVSSFIYPTSVVASFLNTWPFGEIGCVLNGFGGFVFNASNMITMALLALERYYLVCRPIEAAKYWTVRRMWLYIGITWIYVTIVSVCPLFGWSRYVPEPYGLSCTVDWFRRTPANVSYVIFTFTFIFFIPVGIMIVCYAKVVKVIITRRRVGHVTSIGSAWKNDHRDDYVQKVVIPTIISLALVVVFLVCWTPYAVISFLCMFKDAHSIADVNLYAIAPTFAKTACFLNPFIYGLGHTKFRAEIGRLMNTEGWNIWPF